MSVILWGQYPRSEKLVQATRDWDRGRIDIKELTAAQEQDRNELLKLQTDFQYISTGQFHWEDLIRPMTHLSDQYSSSTLTRFFETNTFWRTIEGTGEIDQKKISSWITDYYPHAVPGRTIYTFPFRFLFQFFSSGLSLDAFFPLFEQLPEGLIVFVEPLIGWKPLSADDRKSARHFVDQLKERSRSPIALATTFHDIGADLEFIYSLPVDGIAVDFYRNTIEKILPGFPQDKFLVAGVVDTDSTLLEDKETYREFKKKAEAFIPEDKLYFSHSGPAELLPRQVMDAKVRNLMEALA